MLSTTSYPNDAGKLISGDETRTKVKIRISEELSFGSGQDPDFFK